MSNRIPGYVERHTNVVRLERGKWIVELPESGRSLVKREDMPRHREQPVEVPEDSLETTDDLVLLPEGEEVEHIPDSPEVSEEVVLTAHKAALQDEANRRDIEAQARQGLEHYADIPDENFATQDEVARRLLETQALAVKAAVNCHSYFMQGRVRNNDGSESYAEILHIGMMGPISKGPRS